MAAPEPPVDAVLELGAQKLGMPAGRLSRGVNQQLFWKVVVVFDIHEPRGKRGGQAPRDHTTTHRNSDAVATVAAKFAKLLLLP